MRIPIAKYGLPQVVVLPLVLAAAMSLYLCLGLLYLPSWAVWAGECVLAILLVFTLAFFRDPERAVKCTDERFLAPADGKIVDIEIVENEFIGGQAIRIGIFLSIFDVHVNRSPCEARIKGITYRPGKFLDARDKRAGKLNESNELRMVRLREPRDRLIVRQVSGAVARRIVCAATEGRQLACGERFGMIKFGSRTELYVPRRNDLKCMVKVGQKVKAGLTTLARYEKCQD